jgi:serine/threonine-protein kinase RsbW
VENVAAFRSFVEEACRRAGADESTCLDLKLAVDEACSNLVVHGYAGREPGPVRVSFGVDGEEIVITIVDRAPPFDPTEAPVPDLDAPASERRPGGLGWHIIRQIMDRVTYLANAESGNRLTMVKKFVPTRRDR